MSGKNSCTLSFREVLESFGVSTNELKGSSYTDIHLALLATTPDKWPDTFFELFPTVLPFLEPDTPLFTFEWGLIVKHHRTLCETGFVIDEPMSRITEGEVHNTPVNLEDWLDHRGVDVSSLWRPVSIPPEQISRTQDMVSKGLCSEWCHRVFAYNIIDLNMRFDELAVIDRMWREITATGVDVVFGFGNNEVRNER